jgi:Icc-related predicted phosphoesterase
MKCLATADIHAPDYLDEFRKKLIDKCRGYKTNIVFLAGDFVDRGKSQYMPYIVEALEECGADYNIGVFGNDDYEEVRPFLRKASNKIITWLEDSTIELNIENMVLQIFGTTGILDEPTRWQSKNIGGIREIYQKRLELLKNFAKKEKDKGTIRIVLTHYPPTYKTLVGEPRFAWRQMGSIKAEKIIKETQTIDYVIHGHAHRSRVLETKIGSTTVLNVAFPARKDVVEVKIKATLGLLSFI